MVRWRPSEAPDCHLIPYQQQSSTSASTTSAADRLLSLLTRLARISPSDLLELAFCWFEGIIGKLEVSRLTEPMDHQTLAWLCSLWLLSFHIEGESSTLPSTMHIKTFCLVLINTRPDQTRQRRQLYLQSCGHQSIIGLLSLRRQKEELYENWEYIFDKWLHIMQELSQSFVGPARPMICSEPIVTRFCSYFQVNNLNEQTINMALNILLMWL